MKTKLKIFACALALALCISGRASAVPCMEWSIVSGLVTLLVSLTSTTPPPTTTTTTTTPPK